MRISKLTISFLAVSLLFVSCTSMKTPEEKKADKYASYLKKGYPEKEAAVFSLSKDELLEFLAPIYGIPANIEDYDLADKDSRSIIYNFAVGKYQIRLSNREQIRRIADNHGDIVSFFTNATVQAGTGFPVRGEKDPLPSYRTLFENQIRAVLYIQEIRDRYYTEGYLTDDMSEYEKAVALSHHIWRDLGQHQTSIHTLETDSAYNGLNRLPSNCGARSAIYTMFLHLEGIQAQTIPVLAIDRNNDGHMLTRAILDGTEYYIDWANNFKGIRTPEEWKTYDRSKRDNFAFNEDLGIRLF